MLKEDSMKYQGNERYEGYCADLTAKICRMNNLKCKLVPVKDNNYGTQLDNGVSWNGMVGELLRRVS